MLFELYFGLNVQAATNHLDGIHGMKQAQSLLTHIEQLISKAGSSLQVAYQWQAKYYSTYYKALEFELGSEETLINHSIALKGSRKFKPRFIGAYKVLKQIGPQTFKLAPSPCLVKSHDIFYVSLFCNCCYGGYG